MIYPNQQINTARRAGRALVDRLWRGGAIGCYQVKITNDFDRVDKWSKSRWCNVGESIGLPLNQNVYMSVNPMTRIPPTNAQGRAVDPQWMGPQIKYIACVNALYADFDAKLFGSMDEAEAHIYTVNPPPSAIVRSGGGFHCYWFLHKPFVIGTVADTARVQTLQWAWVEYVRADKAAKSLNRVLRLPGSFHTKQQPHVLVEMIYMSEPVAYGIAELERYAQSVIDAQRPPPQATETYQPITEPGGTTKLTPRQASFVVAGMNALLDEMTAAQNGHRHDTLMRVAARAGAAIGAGYVGESAMTGALRESALTAGLSEHETDAAIRDGIRHGKTQRFDFPASIMEAQHG